MKMTKFTKEDWDAFAGCESEEPTINWKVEITTAKGKYTGCVILDDNVVSFYCMNEKQDKSKIQDDEIVYGKEFCCRYSALQWLGERVEKMELSELIKDGFESWQ